MSQYIKTLCGVAFILSQYIHEAIIICMMLLKIETKYGPVETKGQLISKANFFVLI